MRGRASRCRDAAGASRLRGRQRARPDVSRPRDQRRAGAVQVEDFPYVTEEFFVSGTANGAPYTTRIIVRRPQDVKAFSGMVVAEALHAGGRSLVFEWSRVSILTRRHMFVEIVHSPANIDLLKTFNAERYASLSIAMGQTNEIIAQVGHADEERHRPVRRLRRAARSR